jgi:hypothetical protein
MATGYDVHYPENMAHAGLSDSRNWAETTLCSVVDSIEHYARTRPLSFGLWTFGIGFVLGWKLKLW